MYFGYVWAVFFFKSSLNDHSAFLGDGDDLNAIGNAQAREEVEEEIVAQEPKERFDEEEIRVQEVDERREGEERMEGEEEERI